MTSSPGVTGFPCPDCGERLATTMERLLAREPLVCRCGLTLRIDEGRSQDTLNDLAALQARLDQLRR